MIGIFEILNMNNEKDADTIEMAIGDLPDVIRVRTDLVTKVAKVEYEGDTDGAIRKAIRTAGFEVKMLE
ncbi:MAG: heavy-metal-associated domain-containing protein [Clostridiales bacterium]|jgi:copper chaperone CopZ|nr:heavy-metal-associated domain-containing protein [Clostridiales bacterium]